MVNSYAGRADLSVVARVCIRHPFEYAESLCSTCGAAFCFDCLVYPRGPKKPPLCVQCAIAAAGVRASAKQRTELSKRQIRKEQKLLRREQAEPEPPDPQEDPDPPAFDADPTHARGGHDQPRYDPGFAVSWQDPDPRDPHPNLQRSVPRETDRVPAPPLARRPRQVALSPESAAPVDPAVAAPKNRTPPDSADSDVEAPRGDTAAHPRLRPLRPAIPDPARKPTATAPPPAAPAPRPTRPDAESPPRASRRLVPKPPEIEPDNEDSSAMLSWIDNLIPPAER